MGLVMSLLSSGIIPVLLSFLAMNFSIVGLIGCDYVRLNFGPINDRGIYFNNEEFFGLGLFRHEDFDTNKNSRIWEHDGTCYDYDDLDTEMFRASNLSGAAKTFLPGVIFSAITLLILLSLKYKGSASKVITIAALFTSALTLIFQGVAHADAMKKQDNAICDPEDYGDEWYERFPLHEYPDVSYMKFFEKCTLGSTGKMVVTGILLQAVTFLFIGANGFCCSPKAEEEAMVSATPRVMTKKLVDDEENQNTIQDERSADATFATNPSPKSALAPVEPSVSFEEPAPVAPLSPVVEPVTSFEAEPEPEIVATPPPAPVEETVEEEPEVETAPLLAEEPSPAAVEEPTPVEEEEPAPAAVAEVPVAVAEEKFEDDISYSKGDADAVKVDDDLSLGSDMPEEPEPGKDDPPQEIPNRPQTPIRKAKSINAGTF